MSSGPRVAHITTVDSTLRFLLLPQLRRLRDEGYEVTGISAPGEFTADLEAEGIRHIAWEHATRAWRPASDLRATGELLRILRRERFDIVHTHNPKPGIVGRIVSRFTGVPCVVNTVHGLYATPESRITRRAPVLALEWLAARFSHLELYQSEEDLRWARARRIVGEARSRLLGNGVDVEQYDAARVPAARRAELRAQLGIDESALVVGTVGRLVAEKGYREFFDAAGIVGSQRSDVTFLAVGPSDPDKGDALGRTELERARRNVVLAGWRDDVRDLLAVMDVFVLASRREGLPRSAVEAAAMGLPLVLTDIRGCREVGRHGVEAILIPPRRAEPLADAVLRLASSPEERSRLGAAARSRACERFDERRVFETILASYRALIEATEQGAPRTTSSR
jgi:glycosyltransferase involved in cell wall biosynthesis